MVVEALLLLDEVVPVSVLGASRGGGGAGRDLDLGDDGPLRDGEDDADDAGDGDEHLGAELPEDRHGRKP